MRPPHHFAHRWEPWPPQLSGIPRRTALAAARLVTVLLLSGAAFPQTSEPQYITDLTTAISNILSNNIALAGTPLPRVKFAGHHLPAAGAFLSTFTLNCPATSSTSWQTWSSSCVLKAYTDGLVSMGVDLIHINIWTKPYATGDTATQLLYANLVNYIHAQTCNGSTCEVELNPADLTFAELTSGTPHPPCWAINSGLLVGMSDYQKCLTVTTTAMVTMATDSNYTMGKQPEHFTVIHECSTFNHRFGWDGVSTDRGTASDWRGFVDAVAGKLSAAGYTGKVGAGGCLYWEDGNTVVGGNVVPNFCGDSAYGFNGDTANLQYITYDVYNALSTVGPSNYYTNMATRTSGTSAANYVSEIGATVAAGWTDVRIEESASPPFVYAYDGGTLANLIDTEPNTTADSYRGCGWNDWNTYGTDRQWLDMIFKFASAQKMTSVGVFYTFPFFAYTTDPANANDHCNPAGLYTVNVVSNSLGSTSPTGTYFKSLSRNWPTVIATGSVKLTGKVKLQ